MRWAEVRILWAPRFRTQGPVPYVPRSSSRNLGKKENAIEPMITGTPERHVPASAELPLFPRPLADRSKMNALGQKQPLGYLISILRDARWHTAKELKTYGFDERQLRELVENSEGQIFSFPGSPGYKSFDYVTEDEFQQAKALLNQGRAMIRRWLRYCRRHHKGT